MLQLAANLTLLFTELPFLDRFQAARSAGFQAVEILFPYGFDPIEIKRALDDCALPLALINTPAGDFDNGERGHGAIPGAEKVFATGLKQALDYARVLHPRHIHVMSGNAIGPAAQQTLIENLIWATAEAPDQNLLIEPLNPYDMPGYFLADFDLAAQVIASVNAPNLGLQFDAYHAQRMTGDVPGLWQVHKHLVRHIQIAGTPGRHEPLPSEIDYVALFQSVRSDGYEGYVSAEYNPAGSTTGEGLGWMQLLNPPSL